jgi:hypothetical protein
MHEAITAFLNPSTYHRCLLLVHADPHRLDQAASELAAAYGWPRLSLGQELSAALLAEPLARRPRLARRWLDARLRDVTDDTPLLCTQIDLLLTSLKLDPLRLLHDASRTTPIAVTWLRSYQADVLA